MDHGMWRCIGASPARAEAFGYGRFWKASGVFFPSPSCPLQHEKAVSGNTETRMMMEPSPAAPFEVMEPEFALELLVVALDHPARLRGRDQVLEGDLRRQRGKPVVGG